MAKKKGGRPSRITTEIKDRLLQAFAYGLSDREACLYAGIAPSTLYSYCEKHPKFSEQKEELKNRPKLQAKVVIFEALKKGDVNTAKWYLERKAKEEFGNHQTLQHTGEVVLPIHERKKLVEEYMRDFLEKENEKHGLTGG